MSETAGGCLSLVPYLRNLSLLYLEFFWECGNSLAFEIMLPCGQILASPLTNICDLGEISDSLYALDLLPTHWGFASAYTLFLLGKVNF